MNTATIYARVSSTGDRQDYTRQVEDLAAIAIALGAYWHIYTLGMCAVMVYALKHEEKTNKQ